MTRNNKNVVFISEYAPLKGKGSGISVLLHNILLSLVDFNIGLVTFCGDTKVHPKEILADNINYQTLICDRSFFKLFIVKGSRFFRDFLIGLSFIFSLPRISKIANSEGTLAITMVGVSAKPLWKFLVLKTLFKKAKHGIYIVDDLELINIKNNNKIEQFLIRHLLPLSINKADFLLTISPGLKDTYLKQFGKNSYVLLPHFSRQKKMLLAPVKKEFSFLFTGGLNFLYNDSLLVISSVIDAINQSKVNTIKVKLIIQTYSSKKEFDKVGFKLPDTIYSTVNDRENLLRIYDNCQSFVVPYSFNAKDKSIVETSFPQKVAEIIQYGKPIFVFGPDYSSVVRFFRSNELNYVCDELSNEGVKENLLKIISEYDTFSADAYSNVYDELLSSKIINRLFQQIFNDVI